MANRKGKKRKRGNRTQGHGNTKNNRGKGSKKGTASAKGGRNKMHLVKKGPKQEKGFTSHNPNQQGINLRDLKTLTTEEQEEINITEHGYDKVLGGGKINQPLTIKAKSFSKKAEEKIEEAGGAAEKVDK